MKTINKCSKRVSFWNKKTKRFEPIDGIFKTYEDNLMLDESFDSGKLEFIGCSNSEIIPPMTPLRIQYAQNNGVLNEDTYNSSVKTEYYLTADTFCMPDSFLKGSNSYLHRLQFVELTNLLANEMCDTLTFTNKIWWNEAEGGEVTSRVMPNQTGNIDNNRDDKLGWYVETNLFNYYSPCRINQQLEIYSFKEMFRIVKNEISSITYSFDYDKSNCTLKYPSGVIKQLKLNERSIIELTELGKFEILYSGAVKIELKKGGDIYTQYAYFTSKYVLEVAQNNIIKNTKPYYTIAEVLKRIVEVGITRRDGVEEQKYKIDESILEQYKDIRAPEFHITRCTLFEALLEVGHYIHAVPRLLWNESENKANIITFDKLGEEKEWIPNKKDILVGYSKQRGAPDYIGALECNMENMINTTNEYEAVVKDIIKTTRTERGSWIIANNSAIVETEYPIYRVVKLEVINHKANWNVDITPYLYENAEYGTLSDYSTLYPDAKCYALCYTQGQKNIVELNHVRQKLSAYTYAKKGALENILVEKFNKTINAVSAYKDLSFRVTYIPIVSARILQKKAYKGDFDLDIRRTYNQQYNTVESNFFGEHIKGLLALLGNEIEYRKYMVYDYDNWPKLGQCIDGKYIFNISRNILYNDCVEFTMYLTADYNRLNVYYGLKSNYRQFEISEKQSIERAINYSEDVYLTFNKPINTRETFGLKQMGEMLSDTFLGKTNISNLAIIAQGFTKDKKGIQNPIIKAPISSSFGNSLLFMWKYDDNFSAGVKAVEIEANENKYSQQLVPYGDVYGELYYLKLHILKNTDSANLDEAKNAPECEYDFTNTNNVVFDYATDPLVIRKDSRECLNVTTQINFVAEDKEIVIGRLLCLRNSLVNMNANYSTPKLVLLPYKVNMLNSYLDLTNATLLGKLNEEDFEKESNVVIGIKPKIKSEDKIDPEVTYKSWAIVDTETGEYYLAVNNDKGISNSVDIKAVYFNY